MLGFRMTNKRLESIREIAARNELPVRKVKKIYYMIKV